MKKHNIYQILKKRVYSFLVVCFATILFFPNMVYNQTVKEEIRNVTEAVAKYSTIENDLVRGILLRIGYEPLTIEWNSYPVVNKLRIAYITAEEAKPGNGKKVLNTIAREVYNKYDGAKYDLEIKKMYGGETVEHADFIHPPNLDEIKINPEIRRGIESISEYTEKGALGGTRRILLDFYGLSKDEAYDVLIKSKSSKEALEVGLTKAQIPPEHKVRIAEIVETITKKYDSARYDIAFERFLKDQAPYRYVNKVANKKKLDINQHYVSKTKVKETYKKYLSKEYPTPQSRKYEQSIKTRDGFGGIIFGSTVEVSPDLGRIKRVDWIPYYEEGSDSITKTGMLEVTFEDGSQKIVPLLFEEDVFLANQILSNSEIPYKSEDGIGLVGIEYIDLEPQKIQRGKPILHPDIFGHELGWVCVITDFIPGADLDIINSLKEEGCTKKEILLAKKWLSNVETSWKITDVPMIISNNEEIIEVKSNYQDNLDQTFLRMFSYHNLADTAAEEKEFRQLLPPLTNSINEYERLNQFAKVLGLFRWFNEQNVQLVGLPEFSPAYEFVHNIYLDANLTINTLSIDEDWNELKKSMLYLQARLDSISGNSSPSFQRYNKMLRSNLALLMRRKDKTYLQFQQAWDREEGLGMENCQSISSQIPSDTLMWQYYSYPTDVGDPNDSVIARLMDTIRRIDVYDLMYRYYSNMEDRFILSAEDSLEANGSDKIDIYLSLVNRANSLKLIDKKKKQLSKVIDDIKDLLEEELEFYSSLRTEKGELMKLRDKTLSKICPNYLEWKEIQYTLGVFLRIEYDNIAYLKSELCDRN